MIRITMLLPALLLAASSAPAVAVDKPFFPLLPDFSGTPEEQAACRPDAIRLCKDYLQDNSQVLACFQRNRSSLRPACQAVLTKYGV